MPKKESIVPKNASFNMRLDMFTNDKYNIHSYEKKKELSFAKHFEDKIQIEDDVSEIISLILETYELKGDTFHLKNPTCFCGNKLRKKEVITKIFPLIGGGKLILRFQTYMCERCKKNVRIRLPKLFEENDVYPSYIKNESIDIYTQHLSSYDKVIEDMYERYKLKLSKRTVRIWILEKEKSVKSIEINPNEFSGYFSYDELFVKVFEGEVGIKGAKLERVEKYMLLLRDNVTKKPIVSIIDSLEEEHIILFLYNTLKLLIQNNVLVYGVCADGKREYKEYIKKVNRMLIEEGFISREKHILFTYDIFHFKKNLYEDTNEQWSGTKHSKEPLPEHLLSQIKQFDTVLDAISIEEADKNLQILLHQKNTFIKPLRHHIDRLNKYKEEYLTQIVIKELRTSNTAENYFHIIKPNKIKKEYKTKKGLNGVAQLQTIQKFYKNKWLSKLNLHFGFAESLEFLLNLHKLKILGGL